MAIVAALDTKGAEAQFIADIIRQRGHSTLLIDTGVLADPSSSADVSAREVACEGGIDLESLRRTGDKAQAMATMTHGAASIATKLHADQRFDGIIGIGGSAGTVIGSSAMRALPIGVPKVMSLP